MSHVRNGGPEAASFLLRCVVCLGLCASAAAQPVAPAPAAGTGLDALRQTFLDLHASLQAVGGISPQDQGVIGAVRERAAAFNASHPDSVDGLAIELQLSMWLEDNDRVNELFERLTRLTRDVEYGVAWARYFRRINDPKRIAEVYSTLVEMFPDEVRVRVTWADYFKGANLYRRAIEIFEEGSLDPAANPEAILSYSECLFAEERYQDALDVLESIPQDVRSAKPGVAKSLESVLPARREYPGLWQAEQETRSAEAVARDLPRIELVTSQGVIVVELFENEAPNTVANFIALAQAGYYDGTTFHRVIPNFMAQAGDPNSRPGAEGVPGQGGPGYRIPDEFDREGARKHFTGSLAMAKTDEPNSGGSQFYITHTATPHLNGKHTVFGRVLEGLDVARALEPNDVLESVTVIRKRDHEYVPNTIPEPPPPEPGSQRTIVPK